MTGRVLDLWFGGGMTPVAEDLVMLADLVLAGEAGGGQG